MLNYTSLDTACTTVTDFAKRNQREIGRLSGGTAIYLRNDYAVSAEQVLTYSKEVVEVLSIYFKKRNLNISVVYSQPDNTVGGYPSNSIHFSDALDKLQNILIENCNKSTNIIVCGDFNLPHASWPEGNAASGSNSDEQTMISNLQEFSQNFFMTQIISEPTHKDRNVLDLVLTNNDKLIHDVQCIGTLLSTSHHKIIEVMSSV